MAVVVVGVVVKVGFAGGVVSATIAVLLTIVILNASLALLLASFKTIENVLSPSAPEVSKLIVAFPSEPIVPTLIPLTYISAPTSPFTSIL